MGLPLTTAVCPSMNCRQGTRSRLSRLIEGVPALLGRHLVTQHIRPLVRHGRRRAIAPVRVAGRSHVPACSIIGAGQRLCVARGAWSRIAAAGHRATAERRETRAYLPSRPGRGRPRRRQGHRPRPGQAGQGRTRPLHPGRAPGRHEHRGRALRGRASTTSPSSSTPPTSSRRPAPPCRKS